MGAIRFIHRGHFEASMTFLGKLKRRKYLEMLDKYGQEGVKVLSIATPKDTGKTFGHGTRNGGYVRGIDYINPALRPVFEEIANSAWKEVTGA